ncbi:SidA/IucD/PvdA family monooxygenase|nr:SidA/IucD/PvdA family monooxygenase [Candidatus Bathyarchaeota archaeon]
MVEKVLIIGGVATGPKAAARLRRLDNEMEITIIEKGDLLSYAGCGMPFYIGDIVKEYDALLKTATGEIRDAKYFKETKDIEILDLTEALNIDRESKTVRVLDLKTQKERDLPYDKLVLATGASPFVPKMEGIELEGVHRLYTPHHARAIKQALDAGASKIAIVGGGLIGMETCSAFIERGIQVTILEMMPNLVPNLMDPEMALLLENYLRENGAKIITGSPVNRILDDGEGKVAGVETADGRRVDADMVIVAIGVRPNTKLGVESGLETGPTRAISVNEFLQTNDPDIYAGGDCIECKHLVTGEKVYAPMGSTANKHGRIIANNIKGMKEKFPGVLSTAVFKILDFNCGSTGLTEKQAREHSYDVVTSLCPKHDYSHYIPGSETFVIKLVADKSGKLLGCQVVGKGEGIKRIDVAATVLNYGGTVKDLADLDLAYAPPYSTAIDAIAHAANVVRNKNDKLAHGIDPLTLKEKLESDEDFMFIDCRGRPAYEANTIKTEHTVNIPLGQLKEDYEKLPKDKEIIFFCNTSITAYIAERVMRNMGFENVKFSDGSLQAWPFPKDLLKKD